MNAYQEIPANYNGDRFQRQLGELVASHQPSVMVETGCGISTLFILRAMDKVGKGKLYSVDPEPAFEPPEHPRLVRAKTISTIALPAIKQDNPHIDIFLHDSDHSYGVQTYEYNFAWDWVRSGGWILSDDTVWGGHGAWPQFLTRNGMRDIEVGCLRGFRKP